MRVFYWGKPMNMPAIAPPRTDAELMRDIAGLYGDLRALKAAAKTWKSSAMVRGQASIARVNEKILDLTEELKCRGL